ncbi:hypothetical protein Tco_0635282 [Tanacetum coccineum]
MRELREDTFFGNKDEDAHDHIDRILSIVGLFNIPGVTRRGPPGYYTKIDNHPPYGEKRQSLEELLAKHQEEFARRSTEMEVLEKAKLMPWFGIVAFENNPTHRSFDDYKWEFNLEIDKLADEYELGIGKNGYILDNIWEYCNLVHNKNYEWHNYDFENEECEEIGIEDKDYHPPEVQVETLRYIQFRRISLTGFPPQSVRSSNAVVLDSPYLLVLITETSQSRQHESRKSPATEMFDVNSRRISIHHCEY